MSWEGYPAETRAALRVAAVDPTRMFSEDGEDEGGSMSKNGDCPVGPERTSSAAPTPTPALTDVQPEPPTVKIAPGSFIIANHADELTPWTPVLVTLSGAAGYLSIPCCAWAFDARFQRGKGPAFPTADVNDDGNPDEEPQDTPGARFGEGADAPSSPTTSKASRFAEKERERQEKEAEEAFIETLNLGGDGSGNSHKSAYSQYRIWLARLSAHCGWEVECETLRMPSTRAWAVVGRRKAGDEKKQVVALANARAIVDDVKRRALFKTRRPEGKAGDH
ncbi:hypothetical protein D9619_011305 [Psilocybe cf. subviscida]|uniref:tRNA (uracil-O(2)-)-methyltransferase n=1 Tax=Psilocybe cf. subviscida TaxID=2480587 RepID=A0A8H5F5B6_9AGAR|nr:hypothetical protein D9619_011305 [Psilocybe cf. subviscida]